MPVALKQSDRHLGGLAEEPEMMTELASDRLSLRPVDLDRVEALHSLWTDEPVRRFLWDGEVIPPELTREIVEKNRTLFEEHGFGIWGIFELDRDELLGFAGYWHFRTPPTLELLFGVATDHWHRGLATESSQLVVGHGFRQLGFDRVDASTDLANTASVRVLERLGMSFDRRERVDGLETVFYTLTRDDWASAV